MWVIQTKKYAGILSQMAGINNIVYFSSGKDNGKIRVSVPSRVGYGELVIPELDDEGFEGLVDIAPLVQLFGSKACNEVFFSPEAQLALFKAPYTFKKQVLQVQDEQEELAIKESWDVPIRIRAALAGKLFGNYIDSEGKSYKVVSLKIDNVILTDMSRQLGAPRKIITITFTDKDMTLTNEDGEMAKYPKPREDVYPPEKISITLSVETQPLFFSSLMSERSQVYIVDEKFVMTESAQGLYTFICAAYGNQTQEAAESGELFTPVVSPERRKRGET